MSEDKVPNKSETNIPLEDAVISLYAAQKKIYPRNTFGNFTNWRWFFVWATQLFFYGMPWLEWGQRQALLFDLEAKRFYIFNLVFYPQDLIYLTAILIISDYRCFYLLPSLDVYGAALLVRKPFTPKFYYGLNRKLKVIAPLE